MKEQICDPVNRVYMKYLKKEDMNSTTVDICIRNALTGLSICSDCPVLGIISKRFNEIKNNEIQKEEYSSNKELLKIKPYWLSEDNKVNFHYFYDFAFPQNTKRNSRNLNLYKGLELLPIKNTDPKVIDNKLIDILESDFRFTLVLMPYSKEDLEDIHSNKNKFTKDIKGWYFKENRDISIRQLKKFILNYDNIQAFNLVKSEISEISQNRFRDISINRISFISQGIIQWVRLMQINNKY